MKKTASWLSNTITPEATIYEFEEDILPKIKETQKQLLKHKIENRDLEKDINNFYKTVEKLSKKLITDWERKLELTTNIVV